MTSPEDLAADPAVRAAVFASVTVEEAHRLLRSRAGKPWCDAMLLRFCDDISPEPEISKELGDSARVVLGVDSDYLRDA